MGRKRHLKNESKSFKKAKMRNLSQKRWAKKSASPSAVSPTGNSVSDPIISPQEAAGCSVSASVIDINMYSNVNKKQMIDKVPEGTDIDVFLPFSCTTFYCILVLSLY